MNDDLENADVETLRIALELAACILVEQRDRIRQLMLASALDEYKPKGKGGRPKKWPDLPERLEPYKRQLREAGKSDSDIAAAELLIRALIERGGITLRSGHRGKDDIRKEARHLAQRASEQRNKN